MSRVGASDNTADGELALAFVALRSSAIEPPARRTREAIVHRFGTGLSDGQRCARSEFRRWRSEREPAGSLVGDKAWLTVRAGDRIIGLVDMIAKPGGRVLALEHAGDPTGRPILVLPGTPSSRLIPARPYGEFAVALGVRLISYDRPGYGGSTAQPGRTVADVADDVRAIVDALRIDRCCVWGLSG